LRKQVLLEKNNPNELNSTHRPPNGASWKERACLYAHVDNRCTGFDPIVAHEIHLVNDCDDGVGLAHYIAFSTANCVQ